MKVSYFALLALVATLSVLVEGLGKPPRRQSHSMTWGARRYRDMHLERVIITEKSKFMRVVTRDYVFEQSGVPRRITQIVVTDQIKNGEGGYARLEAGGPQAVYAKLFFKSQRGKSFSFIVDIYGIEM